jgi:hypothetical protein
MIENYQKWLIFTKTIIKSSSSWYEDIYFHPLMWEDEMICSIWDAK